MFKLCITGDLGFEYWQDIPGYEGLYQASTYGRIKSLSRYYKTGRGGIQLLPERILKENLETQGYFGVLLCNGKQKRYRVHRLVAITFIPNFNNLPCINHKDETRTNNRVENLEWCTQAYNNCYGKRLKRVGIANGKPVLQYSLDGDLVGSYQSAAEAARQLNLRAGGISTCCRCRQRTSFGYVWKYA